ncbi:GAF domain-containing protein [Kribbella sp. NPDC051936]|uniref:GAF domain-containing sensor histidine kinase n=1 Tax=Kribbella sp. NPDC051936 TaxID=3154946 RepID=UPI003442525E
MKKPAVLWDAGALEADALSRVRLDSLLQELIGRVDEILDAQERLRELLDAVVGLGADLDLTSTLKRIVGAACTLAKARYGALGVIGPDGRTLSRLVTFGVDTDEIAAIGPYPQGHGILGLLIERPEPVRLKNLTQHPRSSGLPAGHPPMRSFLGVPIRSRGRTYGQLYLTEKTDGSDFSENDESTVLALATAAGAVIDNARLYTDADRRQRWHEATAQIIQVLLDDADPEDTLRLIVRKAREVSCSLVGAILVTEDDDLIVRALDGPSSFGHYVGRRLPGTASAIAGMMNGKDRTVIDDLAQVIADRGRLPLLPEVKELGRTIIAPLPAGSDHAGGFLVVAAAQGIVLGVTPGTDLLTMFANQTTLALDRAVAQADRSMLTVLADRDRLAKDLHASVIDRLFGIGLQLQGLQRLLPPAEAEQVARSVDDIDLTIREVRDTIFEQRHATGRGSLRSAVEALVDEYTAALGFRPVCAVRGTLDVGVRPETGRHLLAVLREALSNVVRHARAATVRIDIEVTATHVTMRVADDGVGIGSGIRRSGLRNLQDRAAALGGSLELSPNGVRGTALELRAPLIRRTAGE